MSDEFHFCNVLVDWEDGMSTEYIDEHKCVNEAVGKYRYEVEGGLVMEDWLCEDHREEYEDAITEEVETL